VKLKRTIFITSMLFILTVMIISYTKISGRSSENDPMLLEQPSDRCTVYMVGKNASADGSVMTTHSADCGVCDWTWRHVPAADYKPGSTRKIYHITPQGGEALREGLLAALSSPQPCHTSFSIGIGNLPFLGNTETIAALRKYRSALNSRLEHVKGRRQDQQPLPYFVEALFDYSLTMIEAELKWTDKFLAQLEAIDE